ncbi:MAG: hypothetical protein H6737_31640 [Alphaproteobacteria bacterium]|nr:hypothetical protein [Alphaproteobacteria bacterium]
MKKPFALVLCTALLAGCPRGSGDGPPVGILSIFRIVNFGTIELDAVALEHDSGGTQVVDWVDSTGPFKFDGDAADGALLAGEPDGDCATGAGIYSLEMDEYAYFSLPDPPEDTAPAGSVLRVFEVAGDKGCPDFEGPEVDTYAVERMASDGTWEELGRREGGGMFGFTIPPW